MHLDQPVCFDGLSDGLQQKNPIERTIYSGQWHFSPSLTTFTSGLAPGLRTVVISKGNSEMYILCCESSDQSKASMPHFSPFNVDI